MLGGSRSVKRVSSSSSSPLIPPKALRGVLVLQTAAALRKRCVNAEKGEREVWVEERHSMLNQPASG
jgi:hypothetical protein